MRPIIVGCLRGFDLLCRQGRQRGIVFLARNRSGFARPGDRRPSEG